MTLDTATSDRSVNCDGCDGTIQPGEKYLTGINSCCGNCYRRLCFSCVLRAGEMLSTVLQSKILETLTKELDRAEEEDELLTEANREAVSKGYYDSLLRGAALGSFAPARGGGGWLRLTSGWMWNGHITTGSVFPRPGGDWTGVILPRAPSREDMR